VRLFGRGAADRSLHELLDRSGRNVVRATGLLRDLVADYPERAHLAEEIRACENEGDRIAHDIIHLLGGRPPRAELPTDQVQVLARTIDDIVDFADETADIMGLYHIEASMAQAEELADVLVRAGRAVAAALRALAEDDGALAEELVEIHRLENEGDRVSREAIASLFAGGIDPMVVIRWKDVFESLEEAIDACESVAHLLEGLSLSVGR
jgi:uncharacterized protein Yka (UPF0111/DUF47 family)